ncbi:MAG: HetZ-related protein 2 [Oscillatoriales cyanobacterium SM2_3_0]|nr:HetZ-related protein 2 [Oscillatoriales cyanobacterium SM2_3_0]
MILTESLANQWRSQLEQDYPSQSSEARESIVRWLLGANSNQWDTLTAPQQLAIEQGIQFRYRVLQQRYLGTSPEQAYRNLMQRLGGLTILRQKIRAWVAISRDRQRQVIDVLQEVIQEMLHSDRYLQQQLVWIAECTSDRRLRNTLLFTSVEEYCLRPIRNQPLIAYRFVNYLRRSQKGGLTHVPVGEWVRQVSDETVSGEAEDPISLLDPQAVAQYEDSQFFEHQYTQCAAVQTEFATYLREQVDPLAAEWLQLYLRGESQEAIAQHLNLPIKQIYRLREKISYHAVRNFALKQSPELVTTWLGTSLNNRLGLSETQWQEFLQGLTPPQQQILDHLKRGQGVETVAQHLKLKTDQVISEWTKLYFTAQALRNSAGT